jgi:putative membrane protein
MVDRALSQKGKRCSTGGNVVVTDRQRARPEEDPRTRLAGERTLLAWIRTGLGLMGFGFVVARFGLFLREIAAAGHGPAPPATGLSLWIGVAFVLLGITVSLIASLQHARFLGRLERGEPYRPPRWSLAIIVAVVLAVLGAGMTVSLLLVRS